MIETPVLPRVRLAIARGHRQRQVLTRLLAGEQVIHPCYWRGQHPVSPRYQELRAWRNFCTRLVDAGYALHVAHPEVLHPAYTVYRLCRIEEPFTWLQEQAGA